MHPAYDRYIASSKNIGAIGVVSEERIHAVALLERQDERAEDLWVWDITSTDMESGSMLVRCLRRSQDFGHNVQFMHTVDDRFKIAWVYFK